ncbi:DUF4387 domain-containing protein [Pusillimonas sp. SM2304]|uniref:DUF4387 domain-containing protein n=1 Tax=Pusillimonas sp. SM2304 TaxID=3073241 RepID=UPI002874391D|nr:DUF4387 domain-containing protein [Pusillimonas sp. SM2304]MDS1139863.1 DUF4387 domain-containing protein [Pusillimonas sp. SM2304]
MATLESLADVLRSKNAGPFQITIDIMFNAEASYRRVSDAGVLTPQHVAKLYQVAPEQVRVIPFDRVRAIKITLPRRWGTLGSGSGFDRDVYGAQQHGPLCDIEIA